MSKTRLIIFLALAVLQRITFAQEEKCLHLEFPHSKNDIIQINENDYINLTFWLNISGCKQYHTMYKMSVKIKTDSGFSEGAGRLAIINGTCYITIAESLLCVSPAGPAQLYRRVSRSHAEVELKWWWKDSDSFKEQRMAVKLNVSYPPSVTNLTVEAQEVKGHYVIDKSQQVVIVCSFEEGNPPAPATFHLLDKNGREVDNVIRKESDIILSLAAGHCEQPWPVVRCEAQGSSKNRSVTFLVRCPPQFVDMPTKQIDLQMDDHVIFNITSHTKELGRCLLTPESLREKTSSTEVNCSLSGNPPDLLLTLHLQKEDRMKRGNWTLTVSNEIGEGNTRVVFTHGENSRTEITAYTTILLCSVVLIIAVGFLFVIHRIRTKKHKYVYQLQSRIRVTAVSFVRPDLRHHEAGTSGTSEGFSPPSMLKKSHSGADTQSTVHDNGNMPEGQVYGSARNAAGMYPELLPP